MFKKSEKSGKTQESLRENKEQRSENKPSRSQFQERPRICLIDVEENICESLKSSGFNCFNGTLGSIVQVPNKDQYDDHYCRLNYKFPPNLHEYDIVVIDLQNSKITQYRPEEHSPRGGKGQKHFALRSAFPETVFDPRPMSSNILGRQLPSVAERETLYVIFAAENERVEYFPGQITARGFISSDIQTYSTYAFFPELPLCSNMAGKDTKVLLSGDSELGRLLQKHNDEIIYRIAFIHPTHLTGGYGRVRDPNLSPLMAAGGGRIVSFAYLRKQNHTFFFPQIKRKEEFLLDLFQSVLPG